MTNGNDPNDDAGNRALDYAMDNVEKKLAEMDLAELCEEFDISNSDLLELIDNFAGDWLSELSAAFREELAKDIRANETYQQRMSEKLQEQHRAGEVDDWMEQDKAEERAREREES